MTQPAPTSEFAAWPEAGPSRVPAWIYSDPDLFKKEMETFHHADCWSYVGLECEVPNPGDFRRSFVGQKSVLITRDMDGQVNVLENRCAHRGAPVCWNQRGHAKDLVCPYHQWAYSLKGDLEGIPFMRGTPRPNPGMPKDFDKSQNGMKKLRTRVRHGVVWATYSETAPDFETYVGEGVLKFLDRTFPGRPLRLLGYSRQLLPSNWKLYFENSRDPYHATLLHSFFTTFGIYRADAKFKVTPHPNGHEVIYSHFDADARNVRSDVTAEMKTLKEDFVLEDMSVVTPTDEFKDGLISSLQIFPSIFVQQHGNILALRHILPKGPTETELAWTYFGYADDDEDMQRRRLAQGNLVGPAGFVSLDDSEVLAQMQPVVDACPESVQVVEMGGRDNLEPSDTAITENLIRAFYAFYRKEMGL
ncbi:aromatic ring-hydroxylating oxygenase subunit alpha [Brevundimonas sp.]|uniref:aromatic ring-hydroxylating oxygenase subunit alpha n=1 Tax=Brevundimonas sp. TaxID=1871086 RepID=UPI003BA88958